MFRLGESDYTLIKQQQRQQQAAQDQTTHTTDNDNPTPLSKEDREAALSLFRKAKLWGIHVSLPAEQLENLQRDVQGKGPGLAGKGQGLGGVSTAVHEVCVRLCVGVLMSCRDSSVVSLSSRLLILSCIHSFIHSTIIDSPLL